MEPSSVPIALTFDDVLLLQGESAVLPQEVDIATRLACKIQLRIPLLSAAMDSVTEAETAIALARMGGIGIVHRNLTPEAQAHEIERVKRAESGMILRPITLHPKQRLQEAVQVMKEKKISGLPITEGERLVGILTHRDLRFERDLRLRIEEVMTKKLITAGEETTLEKA